MLFLLYLFPLTTHHDFAPYIRSSTPRLNSMTRADCSARPLHISLLTIVYARGLGVIRTTTVEIAGRWTVRCPLGVFRPEIDLEKI